MMSNMTTIKFLPNKWVSAYTERLHIVGITKVINGNSVILGVANNGQHILIPFYNCTELYYLEFNRSTEFNISENERRNIMLERKIIEMTSTTSTYGLIFLN